MSETNSGDANTSTIDLDSMSLDQLNQVKQQEENRLQALTSRYAQLRAVAARFNASHQAVSEISPALDGKHVMVPLTESLYVPGKLRDSNKLLVDVGTGFYMEKSVKDTAAFLDRKVKLVDANSENITRVIQVTRRNIETVTMTMQGKLLEIRAKREGMLHRSQVESNNS